MCYGNVVPGGVRLKPNSLPKRKSRGWVVWGKWGVQRWVAGGREWIIGYVLVRMWFCVSWGCTICIRDAKLRIILKKMCYGQEYMTV